MRVESEGSSVESQTSQCPAGGTIRRSRSSRSSLECSPGCQPGERGFESRRGRFQGRGTQSGKAAKLKPSCLVGSTPTRATGTPCVGWASACPSGCNPPALSAVQVQLLPDAFVHTRPVRLTVQDASPSRWQCRVRFPHGHSFRPGGETGSHATLRTSCPRGLGSSNLPLATAGEAGA